MPFTLPELPYAQDALQPHLSQETLSYHYGKHHKAYVDKLNSLVPGTEFENKSLEEIILKADGPIFNNAAQIWNHTFYWNCLSPKGGGNPGNSLLKELEKSFQSLNQFKEEFVTKALNLFGSGWTWLVKTKDGKLAIENLSNAGNPLKEGKKPLLTWDVWEHAYYIDYRNDRKKYSEMLWNVIHWDFVEKNL